MFTIVFVCTGNRCRSPFAAEVTAQLAGDLPIRIRSAGTMDQGPVGSTLEMIEAARTYDVDLSEHHARCLVPEELRHADLVIGFTLDHVRAATLAGAAGERTFLLPALVEALEGLPRVPDRGDEATARARVRAVGQAAGGEGASIEDPYGLGRDVYSSTARDIEDFARRLLAGLFGSVDATTRPDGQDPGR